MPLPLRGVVVLVVLGLQGCVAGERPLLLGTTTTLEDAGLLPVLLSAFTVDTGIRVQAVVGGTGEVLEKARRGDVDVLLTHSPARERALAEGGWLSSREAVMFNRFVVAGPAADPAGVAAAPNATDAFLRIHGSASPFVSRGDKSGTHDKELEVWHAAGLDPSTFPRASYKETGSGQGATLLFAHARGAYLLVDQATLLQFHARGLAVDTVGLHQGDPTLRNQYAVSLPAGAPEPRADQAAAFADWLTGPRGQGVVAAYRVEAEAVFTPNAGEPGA